MRETKYVLELNDWERRVIVTGLVEARNNFLDRENPIEDICDVMKKVIDAPQKKVKKKDCREAR